MKFKLKKLRLGAGRPVVVISDIQAKKMNVHINDRLAVSFKDKKTIATVDILKGRLENHDVFLSEEVVKYLGVKEGEFIELSLTLNPRSTRYVLKKLDGQTLSKEEIRAIIEDIVSNALTEAEVAYFVSAVYEHGMSLQETIALTDAIYKTGTILKWNSKIIADKHSIGGIAGNRTTPIVVSICASAGVIMPKTSSRAITSAAGTADVIESIADVDFSAKELQKIVRKNGACLAWGGSLGLAPADDKLIRVERLLNLDPEAQLIASILAKKLSVGSTHALIDIPYGPQAKVSKPEAKKLKKKFLDVARYFGLKLEIILTDGSEPIGHGIGPILEIKDVIRVLKRDNPPKDLEDKAIVLSGLILEMVGKAKKGSGQAMARKILESGQAFKKFKQIIDSQRGHLDGFPKAQFKHEVRADKSGRIERIDNKSINLLGRILGSPTDKAAGIYLYNHSGSKVKKGDILMTLYSESQKKIKEALAFLQDSKPIKIQ